MALVECVKCGHLVSTSAFKCPECKIEKPWRTIEQYNSEIHRNEETIRKSKQKENLINNKLVKCPDCHNAEPLKFYLWKTERTCGISEKPCRNCGFPIRIKCECSGCGKRATKYRLINDECYVLCEFHTRYGLEKEDHSKCKYCGQQFLSLREKSSHDCMDFYS
jgi:hypothetical protein